MKEYTYHVDDGHGWLEVTFREFLNAGMSLDMVKTYSYGNVGDDFVPRLYLEEDCHMPLFIKALEDKGVEFKINLKQHNGDCFVRNLATIK